jgi:hypoxanthine-DNA glycosylase
MPQGVEAFCGILYTVGIMLHHAKSFQPVSTVRSRALILGSMPGVRSLAMQQYYAHPQNSFWWIMGQLFKAPAQTYPQRVALIKKNRLALWDVLQYCERKGSLDNSIVSHSIEVNDFNVFLKSRRDIAHVYFNGARAEQEFNKRVLPGLAPGLAERLTLTRLPSTSPAHANIRPEDKLKAWSIILENLK